MPHWETYWNNRSWVCSNLSRLIFLIPPSNVQRCLWKIGEKNNNWKALSCGIEKSVTISLASSWCDLFLFFYNLITIIVFLVHNEKKNLKLSQDKRLLDTFQMFLDNFKYNNQHSNLIVIYLCYEHSSSFEGPMKLPIHNWCTKSRDKK